MNTLLTDIIHRTRQHHGIEHATIHMLTQRLPHTQMAGLSDPLGFTIFGDVDEYTLRRAVGDALLRLQAGETQLAIHPNCGTTIATTGVLVTLVAMITGSGKRPFIERFSNALLFVVATLILSRPIGMRLQSYTTTANVSDRWLASIAPVAIGNVKAHRVIFE